MDCHRWAGSVPTSAVIRTTQFQYAIEHSCCNGFNQNRPPFRLKTDFMPANRGTYRRRHHLDQSVCGFVDLSKALHLRDRVQNSGVMATVVEPANPSRAPAANVLCQ